MGMKEQNSAFGSDKPSGNSVPQRFFIAGYYGFGNVGDEAVLATILDDLRSISPGAQFSVTSERPDLTRNMHAVNAISWRRLDEVIDAIEWSDHVIIGGGGLYNSYFDYGPTEFIRETANYAQHIYDMPILARVLSKPVTVYAVGGGQITGSFPRRQASLSLSCSSSVMVRDHVTEAFFLDLGCSRQTLHVVADPAFRVRNADPSQLTLSQAEAFAWSQEHRPIAVVVRKWLELPDEYISFLAAALENLATRLGRPLLFIPFDLDLHGGDSLSDDRAVITQIAAILPSSLHYRVLEDEHHPNAISLLLSGATAVVSMRLHGCILAVRNAVPLIGINYDPKVRAVLSDIGLESAILEPSDICRTDPFSVVIEQFLSSEGMSNLESARRFAQQASGEALIHARRAFAHASLPELSNELRDLQTRLVARQLRSQAIYDREQHYLMRVLRGTVNSGENEQGFALASIACAFDLSSAESFYLRAVARNASTPGHPSVLADLERAEALGFSREWVLYVRACALFSRGKLEQALTALKEISEIAPEHPGLHDLESQIVERQNKR